MARLDMIQDCGNGDVPRANLIVVPGIAGASLDDRTCPHFRAWLDRLVVDCYKSRAQSWVYDHHLEIDKLESWEMYSTVGDDLLVQLISMLRDQRFGKDGTLILIGHKMGCYILKKALADAYKKDHKPNLRELLDKIDTIIMVGEPNLQADNQWEWFDLICVSIERPLPKKLANDLSVGVLQRITNKFEEVVLLSTLFEVSGTPKPRLKQRWKLKRTEPGGCICSVTIHVRKNTTADEEKLLEKGQGNDKVCTFHPQSTHFQNLLQLNNALMFPDSTECVIASDLSGSHHHHVQDQTVVETIESPRMPSELVEPGSLAHDTANSIEVTREISCPQESNSPQYIEEQRPQSFTDACSTFSTSTESSLEGLKGFVTASPKDRQPVKDAKKHRKRKPALTSLIPLRDKFFSGRESVLSLLNESLLSICPAHKENQLQQQQSRILYLTGSPGIGKTAIAVEYLYRSMDKNDLIFWLNASSQASLGKYCHDFAVALDLVQGRLSQDHELSRAKFLEWLETSGRTFLLVFDDMSQDGDLTKYIPRCGNGSILVTSRHKSCLCLDEELIQTIEVPALSEKEAAEFLHNALFQGNRPDQSEDLCVAASSYHASPLILNHLVNWSIRRKIPIHQINTFLDAEGRPLRLQVRTHCDPIDDVISMHCSTLDTIETQVFNILCFFDPEGVQNRLLLGAQRSKNLPLGFFPRNSEALSGIMQQLWSSSLVEINEQDNSCGVHQAIQDVAKATMDNETFNKCFQSASILVKAQWPPKRKFRNIIDGFWPEFDSLHSHVYSLAHSLIKTRHTLLDPDDDFKQLLINHIWYNSSRGNRAEDHELLHLAYALYSTSKKEKMKQISSAPLPRRCLYVGSEPATITHLVDTDRRHGSYVALSYILGSANTSSSPWKLTKNTIRHYQNKIEVGDLPVAFRDAIAVTRNLGVSYLWIDSLCIVQDSPEDVAEESTYLAEYYANSTVTIAEGGATTSLQGFVDYKDGIVDVAQYSMYRMPRISVEPSNWSVRGWAFQETILRSACDIDSLHIVKKLLDKSSGDKSSVTEVRITDSNVIDDAISNVETPSHPTLDSQLLSITEAQRTLDKGRELLLQGSYIEATATLMLSRDLLEGSEAKQQDALDLHALATSMLGTAYHMLDFSGIALDLLHTGSRLYSRLTLGKRSQDYVMGRIFLSMGICLFGLGKIEESQEKLEAAREQLLESDGKLNEWSASINIKLADCNLSMGKFGEAHALLQSAMNYYQIETSESKQRQSARILHRQSLVYEAEKNGIMHSAFTAAAYNAFTQVMKASDSIEGANTAETKPLSQQAFDELVDPWFR